MDRVKLYRNVEKDVNKIRCSKCDKAAIFSYQQGDEFTIEVCCEEFRALVMEEVSEMEELRELVILNKQNEIKNSVRNAIPKSFKHLIK